MKGSQSYASVRPSPCSTSRRAALRMANGRRRSTITDECRDFDVPLRRKKAFPNPHSFSQNPYFCPAIIPETLSIYSVQLCIYAFYIKIPWEFRLEGYHICFLSAHFYPFHSLQIVCRYSKFVLYKEPTRCNLGSIVY